MVKGTVKGKAAKAATKGIKPSRNLADTELTIDDEDVSSPAVDNIGISEYERARLENIRRNELFLTGLGVNSLKNDMIPAAKAKITKAKSTNSKAGYKVPIVPTRRSSRVTVDKLAAEVKLLLQEGKEEEAKVKQVELDAMLVKQKEGSYEAEFVAPASEPRSRIVDPIPFTDLLMEDDNNIKIQNAQLLSNLLHSATRSSTGKAVTSSIKKGFNSVQPSDFSSLNVAEEDVVKMTPNRITAVALHPSEHKVIGVAGDKMGYLSIWDADYKGSDDNDGIYRYRPHISNVARIDFRDSDENKMYTLSYDGTVKLFDLSQQSIALAFESPEDLSDMYITDCTYLNSTSGAMIISKSDGYASLVDIRASNKAYQWNFNLTDSKLSSIQIHPTSEHLLVTASNKDGININDIRMAGKNWKAIKTLTNHSKTINGAYVSPNGEYLVSVSLDDTVRTWKNFADPSTPTSCNVLRHNNFTGRWLSTFRPTFDPKRAQTVVLGSMMQPRRIEVFTVMEGKKADDFHLDLTYNLQADFYASVNSRNAVHCKLEMILGSNSSGKVHLFR